MTPEALPSDILIRKAVPDDAPRIHGLLAEYAALKMLLPRPVDDILLRIANFRILEYQGEFAACSALRDYGSGLFEIRSLAVRRDLLNLRLGSALIQFLLDEMHMRAPAARVFALTYRANFFLHQGFHVVDKKMFPQKIWSDCAICPKFHNCDETAVLIQIP